MKVKADSKKADSEHSLTAPDEIVALAELYDSYGALLKENQRDIFEAYVLDNLSLSEIAGEYEMTRQGVYDTINRSRKKLREYEDRLGIIEKTAAIEKQLAEMENEIESVRKEQLTPDSRQEQPTPADQQPQSTSEGRKALEQSLTALEQRIQEIRELL